MKTGTLIGPAGVGAGLETGAADGKGKMYFNVEAAGSIEKFDTQSLKIEATWPVAGCGTAQGLTMDVDSRRLFMACDSAEIVVNADNGSVVARIPVSTRSDMNCFDPTTKTLFNPNRADSTLGLPPGFAEQVHAGGEGAAGRCRPHMRGRRGHAQGLRLLHGRDASEYAAGCLRALAINGSQPRQGRSVNKSRGTEWPTMRAAACRDLRRVWLPAEAG